ncbi:hypothetical protein M419DRAFT_5612 [Trichoderma reesei RUT C-30]|uniref:Cyanovirin-N domain-containing protein n=1 Tax=Hypocrea jecorina (strain ATCC 56765 / BCRC 32924 / NRRL 11460 / Rut C-30) TaxID=1344414 RepID=A0A024SHL9_HYPJR|nr:hypothetical protein M419DRAFT_5612 [Trichoderma reesei RUT C-30]
MKSLSVLLLTLASTAVAVPANKYLPVITPTPVVARHVPAVASAPAAPANDDGTTCEQITLGGNGKVGKTTLEGKCTNNKGEWWKTSINLNECITNVGGKLQYLPDGGFDASCRPCTIDTVPGGAEINLKCNCLDWKRIPKFTYLEMGDRVDTSGAVKLVDGRFVCGDRTGDKSPLL